nr:osmotin-like protein [Ipomoea batatas]
MDYLATLPLLLLLSLFTSGYAATFEIRNNCPYTVWAAATPVGGGKQLDQGQSWTIDVPGGTRMARIWGRTNCNFDASGRGSCETGDCGGALQCTAWGKPPNTLAEFTLTGDNNFDTIDISLVDGFNVPLNFAPTKPGADKCHAISCTADVNGQCPAALKLLLLLSLFTSSSAANFEVHNNCPYTVWAAATPVGGGQRLDQGQSWNINVPPGTAMARIWGRTNCNFDGSGRGSCQTGDCGGVLQCTGWGKPPNTLAEFALNQFNNLDFFDISNIDGFNIPISFAPTSPGADKCHSMSCTADIIGQCPAALKVPGGCNNPCTTFGGQQYCCTNGPCGPTDYSRFFKGLCPDAYSYPQDDATSTFTCPGGSTDYRVVFCP